MLNWGWGIWLKFCECTYMWRASRNGEHAQSLLEMVPSLNGSKVNTLITADDSPCNDDLFTVEEEIILED